MKLKYHSSNILPPIVHLNFKLKQNKRKLRGPLPTWRTLLSTRHSAHSRRMWSKKQFLAPIQVISYLLAWTGVDPPVEGLCVYAYIHAHKHRENLFYISSLRRNKSTENSNFHETERACRSITISLRSSPCKSWRMSRNRSKRRASYSTNLSSSDTFPGARSLNWASIDAVFSNRVISLPPSNSLFPPPTKDTKARRSAEHRPQVAIRRCQNPKTLVSDSGGQKREAGKIEEERDQTSEG